MSRLGLPDMYHAQVHVGEGLHPLMGLDDIYPVSPHGATTSCEEGLVRLVALKGIDCVRPALEVKQRSVNAKARAIFSLSIVEVSWSR